MEEERELQDETKNELQAEEKNEEEEEEEYIPKYLASFSPSLDAILPVTTLARGAIELTLTSKIFY